MGHGAAWETPPTARSEPTLSTLDPDPTVQLQSSRGPDRDRRRATAPRTGRPETAHDRSSRPPLAQATGADATHRCRSPLVASIARLARVGRADYAASVIHPQSFGDQEARMPAHP